MRLSSRLLLPILAAVAGVMASFAVWALGQRERTLVAEARRETQAYATALGLALDAAFEDPDRSGVPAIVDRITRQPSIYAVLVYERDGSALFRPDTLDLGPTPPEVDSVLATGRAREVERSLGEVGVYSVVHPIVDAEGRTVGAFEVAQPLSFVDAEKGRTRARFLLNTLVLVGAVTLLIRWLVRRLVSEPLDQLMGGVRDFADGRLDRRIHLRAASGELADVAVEFNRMAASLEQAQSEIVRGAEERLALARHVRHAEKMAAIGQVAAGLAHEIGAPLHVVRGRASLLEKRSARPEAEARDLRIIVEQIDRITGIVRSLLDFARHREPQLAPVDLVGVIEGVRELLASETARAGIEVVRHGAPRAVVLGDRDQLQQVLLNLLLNAIHALQEAPEPRRIVIEVALSSNDPEVLLRVSDTGPGIPDDLAERIFEPFFTTKADGAGTGLGLAVTKRIVEEHRGKVGVATSPGGLGTTFTLHLPAFGDRHDGT